MLLFDKQYYIIRKGDFATNGNTKIIYCMFSSILCIDDYINRNSYDCFFILGSSTIIWSCIEFYLHISKARVIKPMNISFNNNQIQLSTPVGILLQGCQEGGVITTLGLYYGDRIHEPFYLVHMHIFIFVIISHMFFKSNVSKSSKRQVNTVSSVSYISTVTLYNIHHYWYYPEHQLRQTYMFATMIYICSFWTFFAWLFKFRQVEVHTKNKNRIDDTEYPYNIVQKYNIHPATNMESFCVLAYDIIFEIGFAYVFFYNLFFV
jgi:hypothetical protein